LGFFKNPTITEQQHFRQTVLFGPVQQFHNKLWSNTTWVSQKKANSGQHNFLSPFQNFKKIRNQKIKSKNLCVYGFN